MLNKKTMLGVAAISLSTLVAVNANASQPGFYLGGQVGYGNVHQEDISKADMNTVIGAALHSNNFTTNSFSNSGKDTGVAGRLFAGYQVNENWAGELGWTKFSNMDTKASATAVHNTDAGKVSATANGTIKTDAVDLVAKGIYPVSNNVNVYGKLGVAYVMSRANANESVSETVSGNSRVISTGKGSANEHKFLPTAGVGATYAFTNNVAADLSYNRIQKTGSSDNINSTDLVSVGLIYSIG